MNINRKFYSVSYELTELPLWICSECKSGQLIHSTKGVKTLEYRSSARLPRDSGWHPESVIGSFTGILKCNNPQCNGSTVFSGNMFWEDVVVSIMNHPIILWRLLSILFLNILIQH